ncbi:MAG: DUF3179 domain-containing protein [Candidatus Pacebacteria bacterium]|nr:DUF3179 domain-containing protein [Candidatus Paceibacterota bacterium]
MKTKKLILLFVLLVLGWFSGQRLISFLTEKKRLSVFITDFSKKSIDLGELVFGKVGKNDIPDILELKFISVKEAEAQLKDSTKGILVDILGRKRFYPLNILVWHEVINDFFEGVPYSVTYSPFCESVAVYKGSLNNQGIEFRASGLLYHGNLVFYDTKTESLWSQGLGKAIVGEHTGSSLDLVPTTQLLTFKDVKINHYGAEVLSQDTGYFYNYSYNPYSGYLVSDEIPDFIDYENKRFPAKEMMYVVPLGDKSLVFSLNDLPEQDVRQRTIDGSEIRAGRLGAEIIVTKDGQRVGCYQQLWLCWAALHQEDGVVWDIKLEDLNKKIDAKNQVEEATSASVSAQ